MKMPRWDRIYFFAFSAASFAVASFLMLLIVPTVELENVETGEIVRRTLFASGETGLLLLSSFPVILAINALFVVPKNGLPNKSAKINLWISLFALYVFIALQLQQASILFTPTAILMTAAAVGASIRRRQRRVFAKAPVESKSGRGGGKRRRNKG
jgi:hypothetical protein